MSEALVVGGARVGMEVADGGAFTGRGVTLTLELGAVVGIVLVVGLALRLGLVGDGAGLAVDPWVAVGLAVGEPVAAGGVPSSGGAVSVGLVEAGGGEVSTGVGVSVGVGVGEGGVVNGGVEG